MKRLVLTICLPLLFLSGAAQDFHQAMTDLQEQYGNLDVVHVVMKVDVFEEAASTTPVSSMEVEISKKNNEYLYRYGDTEVLFNNKLMIFVNHSARAIVCSTRDMDSEKGLVPQVDISMDSILSRYDLVSYHGEQAGNHHYRIENKTGSIRVIDLYVNSSTKLVSKLSYLYEGKQYVTIDYKLFDRNPAFDNTYFHEQTYVLATGKGKYAPARRLQNYNVQIQ